MFYAHIQKSVHFLLTFRTKLLYFWPKRLYFWRKVPRFFSPVACRTRDKAQKKGLHPNSLYSPLSFNPNMKQRFRLLHVARVYLVAPVAASKALFTAFCAPLAAAALALFTAAFASLSTAFAPCCAAALAFLLQAFALFSAAFAPFSTAFSPRWAAALASSSAAFASLATAFAPFSTAALALFFGSLHVGSSGFGVLLCGRFGFCSAAASSFLAFFASLLALGGLFCGGIGSLLPLGAGFLCALFAAIHFLLGSTGIYLDHLSRSCGTYGENGGESQTAEQRVEIEFHCSVVLVVISIRIGVSFVKTHGVIFYRRHVFPVCACKYSTKARRKQIKTSDYNIK